LSVKIIEVFMTMFFRPVSTLMAIAAMCGAFSTGVWAQETKPAEAEQGTVAKLPSGWFKVCDVDEQSKVKICALNIYLANNKGRTVANVRIVEQEGVSQKGFTFALPPGLLIQPGMRIQIDGAKTGTAKFQICSPQACFAEARFNSDFIASLKRGKEMKVVGINSAGKQVEFPVTLSGFTAAYDGPPLDVSALAENQETLPQRLQRKADEARQRLLEKGQAEGNTAPAAPEAPAAPVPTAPAAQ